MDKQSTHQKNPAAPTRSHPTKTSVKSPVHQDDDLQGAIGNRQMGLLMETHPHIHPSSQNATMVGEMPMQGGMMPIGQGRIQRQPLFGGLSQEMRLENATLALPATGALVQRKLTLGTPGDMYEEEADRVARQVVDEIHSSPNREQNSLSEEERIPAGGEAGRVQRQITVRASGDAGGEISSEWETQLQRAKGGGQPLSPSVKEPMERAFGADFGGVRVHTGAQADRLARSIQAKAFTTGQDVFFRQGTYEPGSRGGQELIAHELTHVEQQKERKSVQRSREIEVEDTDLFGVNSLTIKEEINWINILSQYYEICKKESNELEKQIEVLQDIKKVCRFIKILCEEDVVFLQSLEDEDICNKSYIHSLMTIKEAVENKRKEVVEDEEKIIKRWIEEKETNLTINSQYNNIFAKENISEPIHYDFIGGGMNSLDLVTYNFKLTRDENNQIKTEKTNKEEEKFQGLFKKTSEADVDSSQWGSVTGIPTWAPGFMLRNLAAVEIDKMLGRNLLTLTIPTIIPEKDKQKDKKGILMELVKGVTGKEATPEKLADVKVREDLGVLYILDAIIGNIDRHHGNYIIEEKGGKYAVKGIDNDLAFGGNINEINYGEESNQIENPWYSAIEGKTEKNLIEEDVIKQKIPKNEERKEERNKKIQALSKKHFNPSRTPETKIINGLTIREVLEKKMISKDTAQSLVDRLNENFISDVNQEMGKYLTQKEIEALKKRIISVKNFLKEYVYEN